MLEGGFWRRGWYEERSTEKTPIYVLTYAYTNLKYNGVQR